MKKLSRTIVEEFGGITRISKLTKAPTSTVNSWIVNGISESRLDHLQLAARRARLRISWETLEMEAAQ